jgi:hypothetical protein
MIISRSHANRLVRDGKAIFDGATTDSDGHRWQIVLRYDLQRVDHYRLRPSQPTKLAVKPSNAQRNQGFGTGSPHGAPAPYDCS